MDRKDYFFRQRVTQAELDEGFLGAENADRALVDDLLGFGFLISGPHPATVIEQTVPDLTVIAASLLGYDQTGRRLNNDRSGFQGGVDQGLPPQTVDLSVDENGVTTTVGGAPNEKILSVFIEFTRKQTDSRLDGSGATVFFLQDESIQFNVVQSAEAAVGFAVPPPLRPDQLLLCDVTRIFAQTALLNADIDQSRRENFAFSLLHGASHVSTGSDPIPDAVASGASGLFSGADKAKLDGITFTAAGVSTLFNTQAKAFQPANASAPSATTLDVTGLLVGKNPGGSPSVEGVVTTAPNNRVILRDDDFDDFLDAAGNKVFGRLTEAASVFTLSFFSQDESTGETAFDMTPFSGSAIVWFVQETFTLENLPTFDPAFTIPSDQVAAEIISATTTDEGKVALATAGALVGEVGARANAGSTEAPEPVVRLINGTNISIALVTAGGEHSFTITATGGSFPGFGTGTAPDTVSGTAGAAGTASRTDHAHAQSSVYLDRDGLEFSYQQYTDQSSVATGGLSFRPRVVLGMNKVSGSGDQTDNGDVSVGLGRGTGSGDQFALNSNANANASFLAGSFAVGGGGGQGQTFDLTVFTEVGGVTLARQTGTEVISGGFVVLGDNL